VKAGKRLFSAFPAFNNESREGMEKQVRQGKARRQRKARKCREGREKRGSRKSREGREIVFSCIPCSSRPSLLLLTYKSRDSIKRKEDRERLFPGFPAFACLPFFTLPFLL